MKSLKMSPKSTYGSLSAIRDCHVLPAFFSGLTDVANVQNYMAFFNLTLRQAFIFILDHSHPVKLPVELAGRGELVYKALQVQHFPENPSKDVVGWEPWRSMMICDLGYTAIHNIVLVMTWINFGHIHVIVMS